MEYPQGLQELNEMQDYVRGRLVDRKAFTAFVQSLSSVWHKLRTALEKRMGELESTVEQKYGEVVRYINTEVSSLSSDIAKLRSETKDGQASIRTQIDNEMRMLEASIADVEASIPERYDPSELQKQINSVKMSIPEVKTLQEVWDRFDRLEKKLRALEDTKPSVIRQVFGGGRPVHVPMVDDWSGNTNGSAKTFYLTKQPRSINTMKIWGSDFPYILRANVDFTVSGKAVTLTSEVDAPSNGATLVAEYFI